MSELNLSSFDTTNVTNMSEMFRDTVNLLNIIFGDNFKTSNVINMSYMFGGSGVQNLDLSTWDTSKVTNMAKMFYNTMNIVNIYLSNLFVTTNVTDLSQMFYGSNVVD